MRSTIRSRISGGRLLPPVTPSTRAAVSRCVNRFSDSNETCGCPTQGGENSGRKVTISNAGKRETRSTIRSRSSSELESAQCVSSKISRTGVCRASLANSSISAVSVVSRRRCGSSCGEGGYRLSAASPNRSASGPARAAFTSPDLASSASSLSSRAAASSPRSKPPARSSWAMKG